MQTRVQHAPSGVRSYSSTYADCVPVAHIGGFLMGLLVGTVLYPIISATPRHRIVTWVFRLAAIPIAVVLFVVLIRNFYKSDPYAGTFMNCSFTGRLADHYFPQLAPGVVICPVSPQMPTTTVKGEFCLVMSNLQRLTDILHR